MIQYDFQLVETIVDDYSGKQVTNGWTIIRNQDGMTRHIESLTVGAFNVLAEVFEDREAAYRDAVKQLQKMLDSELAQAEEDQSSALLLAQQADMLRAEEEELKELNAADVVERIGEYTGGGDTEPDIFPIGTRVMFLAQHEDDPFDGKTGEIVGYPAYSAFDYDIRLNSVDRNTIAAYAREVVKLPYICVCG